MIRRLFFAGLLVGALILAIVVYAVAVPYRGFGKEVFVDIPPGTSTGGMATLLADAGVIRGDWQFLIARALNSGANLQAGEYRFDRAMTVWEVFAKIARGDIYYHELRVPEGANMFDIAELVNRLGFVKGADFLRVARDPALIRDLAPEAPSLEGYLFPSTYKFTRRATAEAIARAMTNQFRGVWKEVGRPGVSVNRMVTIASLVEKETGVPEERSTVASVFHNRLESGMRLDCDPTTIYAALLEGRYRGKIYRSDLDSPHPYNTYRRAGLPPGPIANPGVQSLKAALNPAPTPYLFFVAKGDGSGAHIFTESLSDHNAAVRSYRDALAQ